ncbi:MAG: GmrSD restriction endonuclease domain-containing protein [Thermoanaerobaculia bacterium]
MPAILGLLNQIADGEIVLPAIQRNFVWEERKVERLLDSIMRGYPIGLALLWDTHSDLQYREFARDYSSSAPLLFHSNTSRNRVKLVLDGQQRLQSLYVALYGTYDKRAVYLDLLSGGSTEDLADERFLFWFLGAKEAKEHNAAPRDPLSDEVPYLLTRVADLFKMTPADRRQLVEHAKQRHALSPDEIALLEINLAQFDSVLTRDSNILRVATIDENLPADSPNRQSEADVLEIFVRINREGTPLSRSDLIFSMLKLNWKESAEALPDFIRSINDGNSLNIDTDFVIRCLFAMSNLGTRMDLDLLRKPANVALLRSNFTECCRAIQAAVDFIAQDCRCSSRDLTGGLNNLVPLVYYLSWIANHDVPNSERLNVRRAVFLLGFTRAFSRYGDSRLGTFIKTELQPLAEQKDTRFPFRALVKHLSRWERLHEFDESILEGNIRLALHLVQGRSLGKVKYSQNRPEIDHIFPRAELQRKGVDDAEINDLGNYWILARGKNENKSNKHPAKYFADVDDAVLARALINRSDLDYRKYKRFVKARRAAILAAVFKAIDWPSDAFDS